MSKRTKSAIKLLFLMLMCPGRTVGIHGMKMKKILLKMRNVNEDKDHFRWWINE
jgi:hypothetical protein